MTRPILLIAFLFCFNFSFGQIKYLNGIISPNGDTSFWYRYQVKQLEKLALPLLDTSSDKEYYRIWTNRQAIDIWQTPSGTFCGKLTTWTDEYVPNNEEPTNRSFIISKNLTDDTVKLVRTLILTSDILSLPTDDLIKGWQQGFDGITYIIEQSSIDTYSFKTYWTPKAQDSLKEAKQVQDFIDSVFKLTNAQIVWKEFSKTIPYECYINGGPAVACKILTKNERKKILKERKNYRQQKYLQKQGGTM